MLRALALLLFISESVFANVPVVPNTEGSPSLDRPSARLQKAQILALNSCEQRPEPFSVNKGNHTAIMATLERLEMGEVFSCRPWGNQPTDPQAWANAQLMTIQPWKTGTSFDPLSIPGDYDMALRNLVFIAHRYGYRLSDEAWNYLTGVLLTERGALASDDLYFGKVDVGFFGSISIAETENHALMILTSKYLTNKLWGDFYKNENAEIRDRLLQAFQSFVKHDFYEYNSRPYSFYSLSAIQNIAELENGQSPEETALRTAAVAVLDLAAAKWIVSSESGRRLAPYRRKREYFHTHFNTDNSDPLVGRYVYYSGQFFQPAMSGYFVEGMLRAAVGSYRVPESIVDLMLVRRPYEQRISMGVEQKLVLPETRTFPGGIEISSSGNNFLLTGGGVWRASGEPVEADRLLGWDNDGMQVPTTLIPRASTAENAEGLITIGRFGSRSLTVDGTRLRIADGRTMPEDGFLQPKGKALRNVVNSCVYRGFACGYNLDLPDSLLGPALPDSVAGTHLYQPHCSEVLNGFLFINASPSCNDASAGEVRNWNVYIVARQEGCGAFFEVVDADGSFEAFRERVLSGNSDRPACGGWYRNSRGQRIDYRVSDDAWSYPILGVDGQAVAPLAFSQWPFASGDIIQSLEEGWLWIRNDRLGASVEIDFRDWRRPLLTGR